MLKFSITPDKVSDVRKWIRDLGGVWLWTNKEIGNNRPDIITPQTDESGNPYGCPHWAYVGQPKEISETEIVITTITVITIPPQWFPGCQRCNGTGKRSLQSLADIRHETLAELLDQLPTLHIVRNANGETFDCNQCDGTGYCNDNYTRKFYAAIRRKYWGLDITETGKERGKRIAKRLSKHYGETVLFDWSYCGFGLAEFSFFTETIAPFTTS